MTVHRSWTLDRLAEAYTQHQRRTRGLRPRTLRGRARLVQMLVRAALGEEPGRAHPPRAGRCGGVHHVATSPGALQHVGEWAAQHRAAARPDSPRR